MVKMGVTQGNFRFLVKGKCASVLGKTRRLQKVHFGTVTLVPLVFSPAPARIGSRSQ